MRQQAHIEDIEVVADVVRLARAAEKSARAEDIVADVRRMHPGADEIRIRRACGHAADMLLAQHS